MSGVEPANALGKALHDNFDDMSMGWILRSFAGLSCAVRNEALVGGDVEYNVLGDKDLVIFVPGGVLYLCDNASHGAMGKNCQPWS